MMSPKAPIKSIAIYPLSDRWRFFVASRYPMVRLQPARGRLRVEVFADPWRGRQSRLFAPLYS